MRRLRETHGWKQEDLAGAAGCSSQHISAVETGRKPPTLRFARKLDVAFGTADSADSFEREWSEMRRGSLLEGFPEYVAHEGRAVEIRLFQIGIVPGLVMDESCLRQAVGDAGVMEAQLRRLVEVAALPNWVLQVSPFETGARRPFNLPVNLLTLADRSVIAYAESQAQGHLDRESVSVLPMLTAYHQLQAEALSQATSVAMINELRKGTP